MNRSIVCSMMSQLTRNRSSPALLGRQQKFGRGGRKSREGEATVSDEACSPTSRKKVERALASVEILATQVTFGKNGWNLTAMADKILFRSAHFGFRRLPGGGITLSRPPPGGDTYMSASNPVGGQITPLDCASLSLKGLEFAPPPNGRRIAP